MAVKTKENQEVDPVKDNLGKRIQFARKALHLSQNDLAEKIEAHAGGILVSRYERGTVWPDPKVLRKIAEALNRPLHWFFMDDPATFFFSSLRKTAA